jgi:CheY-like chemotaxis protein
LRALILDDQKEVFESVRPILKGARFTSFYANNIEEALELIKQQTFDLVFVDLQMPPGNWGGLEAIKLLKTLDYSLPLVVLSGKGTLAECIEAIRLGAKDYIQKESFEADFRERIVPIYLKPYAIAEFPSLLGYLYRVYQEEKASYVRARKMIDVYEFSMRLLTLIVVSESSDNAAQDRLSKLADVGLSRASLGAYVSFLFDQIAGSSKGHFVAALRASDFKESRTLCDSLTKCRNENFGHSATISPIQAERVLEAMDGPLTKVLNAMACLRKFRFFLVENLRYDGIAFQADGKILSGDNLLHPSGSIKVGTPLRTDEVVMLDSESFVVGLDPLVRIHASGSGEQHAYSLFDKTVGSSVRYATIPAKT